MRRLIAVLLCVVLLFPAALLADDKPQKKKKKTDAMSAEKKAEPKLTERERALHALNRLGFGPRPGDVDRVLATGVDKWIEQQLEPAKEPDTVLEAKLAPLRTLTMQPTEMMMQFPNNNYIRQVAEKRRPMPSDPMMAGMYEMLIDRYNEQQAANAAPKPNVVVMTEKDFPAMAARRAQAQEPGKETQPAGDAMSGEMKPGEMAAGEMRPPDKSTEGMFVMPTPAMLPPQNTAAPTANTAVPALTTEEAQRKAQQEKRLADEGAARAIADKLLALPKEQRMAALMQLPVHDRRVFATALTFPQRGTFVNDATPAERELFLAMNNPTGVVVGELQQGKLLRAIFAERQLEEVMTDFWFNHFNVFLNKDIDQYLVTSYERDAIRAHALGKFRDLLFATAKHPAMLYYLDNFQSTGPDSQNAAAVRNRSNDPNAPGPGLNENFAREVMELHTLGVDGGYTQTDVTELARILTGWGISPPERGGAYEYHPRAHQPGTKHVLGHTFYENGEKEGNEALEMLAANPATAHYISRKLAIRFLSDEPPEELVARMASTFLNTGGDIREVLRTLFHSAEFWEPKNLHAKTKTPLEFVVSAVRATGADIQNPQPLVQQLQRMGMPLYQMQPPTGYKMTADAWMNSDALLDRMNFALGLVANKLGGVRFDPGRILLISILRKPENTTVGTGVDGALAMLEDAMIGGAISENTTQTIRQKMMDPDVAGNVQDDPIKALTAAAGLLLGSPEFQKR